MDQRHGELFQFAIRHGVGIIVRSALLKGILTYKGRNLHRELKAVQQHRKMYNELLNNNVPRLSDLATKFVLSHNEVSSVLLGIDRMEYLQDALTLANGQYLDSKTLARAKELRYPEPDFLDLRRWDKMGWLR
jgi:aryl-alcohol dehydrogenase-like predicted oxidoreductase